ncbi:MAG: DUF547 domain-containing protein [Verrucomicrobia bacterium]|nr:DUF547 domain-containing protein [Verrucomicrobiota bacterium]
MIQFILLGLCALCSPLVAGVDYADYARLLERYVAEDGVGYMAWADNPDDLAALEDFLATAASVELTALSRNEQKAFYINLYNAAMLQAVFHHWPVDSVETIGRKPFSIFKKAFIKLGDRRLSLDDVEKAILLKEYFDPRIHFAVNCASESCPPLRAEPFVGERLDAQLDEQTRLFAGSKRAAQVDLSEKSVAYSELFKWYADDFPGDNPADYLNRYRADPLPTNFEIQWIPYDWSLNAAE